MKQILITTAGNITVENQKTLTDAGVIIVVAKKPDDVKMLQFSNQLSLIAPEKAFMAALGAVASDTFDTNAKSFCKKLLASLSEPEKKS